MDGWKIESDGRTVLSIPSPKLVSAQMIFAELDELLGSGRLGT